jgi:hypothetical protein
LRWATENPLFESEKAVHTSRHGVPLGQRPDSDGAQRAGKQFEARTSPKKGFCFAGFSERLNPQARIELVQCEKHLDTELVCPACAGERGGQTRANKLSWDQRREIARLGGLATRGRLKRRRKDQPNGELRLSQGLPVKVRVRPTGDEW